MASTAKRLLRLCLQVLKSAAVLPYFRSSSPSRTPSPHDSHRQTPLLIIHGTADKAAQSCSCPDDRRRRVLRRWQLGKLATRRAANHQSHRLRNRIASRQNWRAERCVGQRLRSRSRHVARCGSTRELRERLLLYLSSPKSTSSAVTTSHSTKASFRGVARCWARTRAQAVAG